MHGHKLYNGLTQDKTELISAVLEEKIDSVKEIIQRKPEQIHLKNKLGWTPLMIACRYGRTEATIKIIETLIKNGADVNAVNKNKQTALILVSIRAGGFDPSGIVNRISISILGLLIKAGCDLNKQDFRGRTALILVSVHFRYQSYDIFRILVDSGCNLNLSNCDGWTALMMLCAEYTPERFFAIKYLIDMGCDIHVLSKKGRSVLMNVYKYVSDPTEISDLLIEKGATFNGLKTKDEIVHAIIDFWNKCSDEIGCNKKNRSRLTLIPYKK